MGNPALASIIVNNYNYGRFLREAVDSALGQTYPNTEVIVVDDGSTDESMEIIAGYGDRVIPVLKGNGGQASAFNAGFAASRGEMVIFLDADDLLLPTATEQAAELFDDSDVVKVHWSMREVDEHGQETGKVQPNRPLAEGDLRDIVIRDGPSAYAWPPTSGNAWSRRFIERIAPIPEEEYRISADIYLSALAPVFGWMRTIPAPQGCYRRHGQNNYLGNASDARLKGDLRRWEHAYRALSGVLERMRFVVDLDAWRSNSWFHQLDLAMRELATLVPPSDAFILVNEQLWGAGEVIAGRRSIPFLERNGQYWGPPPDDDTAIRELERLRQAGISFIVFAWSAFWWLDYYHGFRQYLEGTFPRVLANDRLIAFGLRGATDPWAIPVELAGLA